MEIVAMLTITPQLIALFIVVVIIELTFLVIGILDWLKQPKEMPDRYIWLIVIIIINIIGPIIYFLTAPRSKIGKVEENDTWVM